jgi:hypothetical protein
MFKTVADELWVFDIEWVPDPVTGRRVYGLADETPWWMLGEKVGSQLAWPS